MMKQPYTILMAFAFLLTGVNLTLADGQYCVTCENPDKTYLCQVKTLTSVNTSALRLYCIRKLSQKLNHASCSVSRSQKNACLGEKVSFDYNRDSAKPRHSENNGEGNSRVLPGSETTPSGNEKASVNRAPEQSPKRKKDQEPETLIELTDQVAKSTGKQLKKAGNSLSKTGKAISKAAKNTWECIGSLFSEC